jgi:hypothetical protein
MRNRSKSARKREIVAAVLGVAVWLDGCSCGSPSTSDAGQSGADAPTTMDTSTGSDAAPVPDAPARDDASVVDATVTPDAPATPPVDASSSIDAAGGCIVAYQQNFESMTLFGDTTVGSQTFADGTDFFDAGGSSYLRWTTSAHGGGGAMNLYSMSSGAGDNTTLAFPAPASVAETLRASFWVYNPFVTSYDIELIRAGGTAVRMAVPGGDWFQVVTEVDSTLSTSDLILRLGLVPNSTGGFTFRIDDVVIERCP